MSMTLAGYSFEGPRMNSYELKTLPGVFAVITLWDTSPVLIGLKRHNLKQAMIDLENQCLVTCIL